MPACRRAPLLLALSLSLAACRPAKVESYRVPKEKDPEMPVAAAASGMAPSGATDAGAGTMAGTNVDVAAGSGLAWTAAAGWQSKPASAMRKGSYAVPGEGGAAADLSITAFPGDVGGELANLNRWRGQVQLPPLADADRAEAVTRFQQNGLDFALVDFAGGQQRILGAIVSFGGDTWFFKLMGPDAVVGGAKPAFLEFLKTVKPSAQP
jgi:hypothetical protein